MNPRASKGILIVGGGRLAGLHAANAVRITSAVTIGGVEEAESHVAVRTSDGVVRYADAVLVGTGISRALDWLAAAGLEVQDGLMCDRAGRTADPWIFGAGDIVCVRDEFGSRPIGHWTAAADSARRAAHAIMDAVDPDCSTDGFFWAEQHSHRLQFVAALHSSGQVTGVFGSNSPRDFRKSRLAIGRAA